MTARDLRRALTLVGLLAGGAATAHDLEEGTARITLRDDHVDVVAEWDLFLLADATPTALATASDEALAAARARLQRTIEDGTQLRVDGAPVALHLTGWPSAAELRGLAAALSAAGSSHGSRVRMRLEAAQAIPGAAHLTLAVPPRLGPVVVSFVQPATRYTRPGATADFTVLSPLHPLARVTPSAPVSAPAPVFRGALGVVVVALAAAGARVFARRAPRRQEGVA